MELTADWKVMTGSLLVLSVVAMGYGAQPAVDHEAESVQNEPPPAALIPRADMGCPPYFASPPPGETPVPFAPEIFAASGGRLHGAVAFSPDGRRVCWSVLPPAVMTSECDGEVWSKPEVLPLPGRAVQAPAFSADGSRLYFQAAAEGGMGGVDLWSVDALSGHWNDAVNLGPPVNGPGLESQPTLTREGDLYFTGSMSGVGFERGIFVAARSAGVFLEPRPLPRSINSPGIDYCPFISPDGTMLLFASNRGHTGEELYLHATFRKPEGGWSEPINLHPLIHFSQPARFPSLSPDGRFLFFLADGRYWWIDVTAVLSLRDR